MIACDNAVPHLLSDAEILQAFREMYRCTRPGGGCLISVRDYASMKRAETETRVVPFGVRQDGPVRYLVFQVWDVHGPTYDLRMYVVEDRGGAECRTRAMRGAYYAVSIERLQELMVEAGYAAVRRLDGRFFQPLLVGERVA